MSRHKFQECESSFLPTNDDSDRLFKRFVHIKFDHNVNAARTWNIQNSTRRNNKIRQNKTEQWRRPIIGNQWSGIPANLASWWSFEKNFRRYRDSNRSDAHAADTKKKWLWNMMHDTRRSIVFDTRSVPFLEKNLPGRMKKGGKGVRTALPMWYQNTSA